MDYTRNKDGSYGNAVIQTMDTEREQVRNRPGNFFGSRDQHGCAHGLFEIVTNALDEIHAGVGNKVIVEVTEDNVYKVADNCGGVPMDMHPVKKQFNWHLIYNKLYGSGKYDSKLYTGAAGLNGVGAAITQFASTYMKVVSKRVESDGKPYIYIMNFKKGFPDGEMQKFNWDRKAGESTGTYVEWQPDPEVFNNVDVDPLIFIERFRQFAVLIPEAEIQFTYKGGSKFTFSYSNGAPQYIQELTEGKLKKVLTLKGSDVGKDGVNPKYKEYEASIEIHFGLSDEFNRVEVYHNGIPMVAQGVTYDGFRDALIRWTENFGKKNGKMKEREKISVDDVKSIIVAVINSKCPGYLSEFKGQHKEAIGNPFLKQLAFNVTYGELDKWAVTNKEEALKLVDYVLLSKTAREKAESVKKNVLKKIAQGVDKFGSAPEKLLECESKDPRESEIYIVEGDSAFGSAATARNYRTQAVYPLIGKIMNCLKKDLEDILKNKVITELIQILGCSLEAKSKYLKDLPPFDISKLRYHKIIISTDADVDGAHITTLMITMFYRLMPSLLKQGYVYIAEAPLYQITVDDDFRYVYSDEEKDAMVAALRKNGVPDRKIDISRFKGLGEMDDNQMAMSTMDVNTRRLTRIDYPEDDEQFKKEIMELMGKDVSARRDMITRYFDGVDTEALDEGTILDYIESTMYEELEEDEEALDD